MGEIYSCVYDFKNGNEDRILDLIAKFDPLLNKLQQNSVYEDMRNELILFMLTLIPKIPTESDFCKQDKYLVSYISKSLKNRYIYLNKINQHRCNSTLALDENNIQIRTSDEFDTFIFNDMIKVLTEKEKEVISKIYLYGYTEAQISRDRNVSRQAIHKTHMRALNKLKVPYLSQIQGEYNVCQ